jgi:hypothetical protein
MEAGNRFESPWGRQSEKPPPGGFFSGERENRGRGDKVPHQSLSRSPDLPIFRFPDLTAVLVVQKFFMKMFEPASDASIQSLLDIKNEEDHEETDFLLPLMPPGYQPGAPAGEVRALRLGERADFPLARPVVARSSRI